MSELRFEPVPVQVMDLDTHLTARVEAGRLPAEVAMPYRMVAYQLDPYRVKKGWPVEVPEFDIRCRSLVSIQGDIITYRPEPMTVEIGADARWVAHADYYDQAELRWEPTVSNFGNWGWVTSPEFAPELTDEYTYRVGKSLITHACMNFDADNRDHFWSDFVGGIDNTYGFTFAMVASLRSPSERDLAGLLCPGGPTPPGVNEFSEYRHNKKIRLELHGNHLAMGMDDQESTSVHPLEDWIDRQAPLYIFGSVNPPHVWLHVATGASKILSKKVKGGDPGGFDFSFVLGRTTGSLLDTADMALFETSFYASPLSVDEVKDEISKLTSIYGGQ